MRKITKAAIILTLAMSLTACYATKRGEDKIPGGEHDNISNQSNHPNSASTKVKLTVTDITMFSDTAMSSFIDCKIVDIEKA